MGKIVRVKRPTFRTITLQKVVIKLSIENHGVSKGLKCVVGIPGVLSVSASHEEDKNRKMTVVGEGIDSVKLLKLLKRKLGHVELLMVTTVNQKEEEEEKMEADDKSTSQTWILRWILPLGGCGNFKHAQDKPLLRRRNHSQNDGSLSPPKAKQKRTGLIPEDENTEENERVSKALIESEHPNSMLCEQNFSGDDKALLCKLTVEISEQRQEIRSLKNTVNQLMALLQQQCQVSQPFLPNTTDAAKKKTGACLEEITEEL